MAYVVTENCIRCKYTDCVAVCPVDCFREGPNFLVIDPDICIDCNLCMPACPADAIFPEEDLLIESLPFIKINAELSKIWPVLKKPIEAPADADEWLKVVNKLQYLEK